jgi:hypothetical protein
VGVGQLMARGVLCNQQCKLQAQSVICFSGVGVWRLHKHTVATVGPGPAARSSVVIIAK